MIKYALGFLFSKDKEKVVLIKKTKPEWQAGFLNGVGGKVEQGETYVEAMIREFEEETGVVFTDWHHGCSMDGNGIYEAEVFYGFGDISKCRTVEEEEIAQAVLFLMEKDKIVEEGSCAVCAAALMNGRLSYPTVVFMNEELNVFAPVPGFRKPKEFMQVARYFGEGNNLQPRGPQPADPRSDK